MLKTQITFVLFFCFSDIVISSRDFKVMHFGKCENFQDTPMLVTEKEIEISDGIHRKTIVEFNIGKELDEMEARLSIYKCNDGGCKHFWEDHKIDNICANDKLTDYNDILVRFIIDATEPKITSCPIPKGTYKTTFSSGNAFFHNFSLVEGIWSVKWSLLDREEMISCYECQVKVFDD